MDKNIRICVHKSYTPTGDPIPDVRVPDFQFFGSEVWERVSLESVPCYWLLTILLFQLLIFRFTVILGTDLKHPTIQSLFRSNTHYIGILTGNKLAIRLFNYMDNKSCSYSLKISDRFFVAEIGKNLWLLCLLVDNWKKYVIWLSSRVERQFSEIE